MSFNVALTNLGKYNEGRLIFTWLELPASEEEIKEAMDKIGINEVYEEYFITDYDTDYGIDFGEYVNLDQLNEVIEHLEDFDSNLIESINEYECFDLDQWLELGENDYILHEGIHTNEDYGNYLVESGILGFDIPDSIMYYFDYESYGRDCIIDLTGNFTKNGLLERCN